LTAEKTTVIREEDYIQCVHCGMCLEHCPTYRVTGLETESPRGRITLMRSLAEGKIGITENFASHISKCLDCRACEVVCPSGVTYGRLVESAKQEIQLHGRRSAFRRAMERFFFGFVLPSPRALAALTKLFFLYQHSGLNWIVRPFLPSKLKILEMMQPPARWSPFPVKGQVYPPFPSPNEGRGNHGNGSPLGWPVEGVPGKIRHRVAFFAGCVMKTGFPGVHEATIEVLRRNGCEVTVVAGQGCCGALNVHGGEREQALQMIKKNINALTPSCEAILVNAAGCGSLLKDYGHLLRDNPDYKDRAAAFSAKVKDVSEFLAADFTPPARPLKKKVAYQDACHLGNAQRIRLQPRELLKKIPGLEFVEMDRPDQCCGSAGIYNIVETDLSLQVLEEKVKAVLATGAEVVVSANPGCMLQLRYGLAHAGKPLPVIHIMELLNQAYESH
jgi:glycolate oxidase iron-sulfur subunit